MVLLANECSVHGQFHDLAGFQTAWSGLMAARATARRFGLDVQCNREFLGAMPLRDMPMQQAIGNLGNPNERRAAMVWLTRSGPFWDDVRRHGEDDWLECDGDLVTDTAVGEAAFRNLHDVPCGLVSLTPSAWRRTPLAVTWAREEEDLPDRRVEVQNWWCADSLERSLESCSPPVRSWDALRRTAIGRFERLVFAENCFKPLAGVPFARSSADQLTRLFSVLNRFALAFADDGSRTAEGHRIYRDRFTGDRAWFSDSSATERNRFRRELTFPHPEEPARSLFCPWHGKERHQTLRVHFTWPIQAGKPVHVVYAGPKLTKR